MKSKLKIPKATLEELLACDLTLSEIATWLGTTRYLIKKALISNGMEVPKEAYGKPVLRIPEDRLRAYIQEEGLSLIEIASKEEVSLNHIYVQLKEIKVKHGLPKAVKPAKVFDHIDQLKEELGLKQEGVDFLRDLKTFLSEEELPKITEPEEEVKEEVVLEIPEPSKPERVRSKCVHTTKKANKFLAKLKTLPEPKLRCYGDQHLHRKDKLERAKIDARRDMKEERANYLNLRVG